MLLYLTTITLIVIVMRKILIGLVTLILLLSILIPGCIDDSGDDKKQNKAPIADAGSDFEVLSLTEIQFYSTNSSDPDGKIESYHWDFGDYNTPGKETSAEPNPKYTYNSPGKYRVRLTVTDDDGSESTTQINITVTNRKPEAEVNFIDTASVYEIIYFNVTAYDFDGFINSYEWDFDGDSEIDWFGMGTGSTTHFYKSPGDYNATLTVTDDYDEQTTVFKIIRILEIITHPPVADAGLNQSGPVGLILLKGSGSDLDGDIVLYEWDFNGDGEYDWSSEASGIITHEYSEEGKYIAMLRVTDDTGLSATDTVTIIINNSIAAQNVSAQIFIEWDTTFEYIISLNNSVNTTQLKVILTDIFSKKEETYEISQMIELDQTKFKLISKLKPLVDHSIQVQVFYYDKLIGARVLDIINESFEYMGQDMDFTAIYDFNEQIEEHNVSETDVLRVTSIGEYVLEHKGDLYYTSLHGTGLYYTSDTYEGSESEAEINASDLWLNTTIQGSEIISKSMSLTGTGTMNSVYEDIYYLDLELKEVRLVRENNVDIENYMYGEGTFSGSITDPESSIAITMSGDVYFTGELLGTDYHKNWVGEEYFCSIERANVTLIGESGETGSIIKTPYRTVVVNTTWNADFEKYTNNSIYYEYSIWTKVANIEDYDEGSGYPENSPAPKKHEIHIEEAITFETPRPRILMGDDNIILESEQSVRLRLMVTGECTSKIGKTNYACVDIQGIIIKGANGEITSRVISSGNFAGVIISEEVDIRWKEEWIKSGIKLKNLN